MQIEQSVVQHAVAPTKAVAVPQAKTTSRLAYIDTVRFIMTVLVIMVHAAVTYGSVGDWTYSDPVQDELTSVVLSILVILSQAFFMGLFFFFAGYFTPGAFDKKGVVHFWKDRLLRLALPMALYTWILSTVPNYINVVDNNGAQTSFLDYFRWAVVNAPDKGPTWFLFALLMFCAGYTIYRLAARLRRQNQSNRFTHLPTPTVSSMLLFALVIGAGMFAVSQVVPISQTFTFFGVFDLQMAFFPQYILMFAAGILAYRSHWLASLPGKMLRFWTWLSVGLAIFFPVFLIGGGAVENGLDGFLTGVNIRCAITNLWFGLAGVSFSAALTLWLRDRQNQNAPLAAFVGANNYTVYLIHPLILVAICHLIRFTALTPALKFGTALTSTVAVCYVLAAVLRKIPGIKAVL